MNALLLFALLGLGAGALIAGTALGVVMMYRATGVINFSTGVIAAWGAYVFYDLRTSGELLLPPIPFTDFHVILGGPWNPVAAFLLALAYCAVLGVLVEVLVVRPLRAASPLAKLLASLGIYLFLQAILTLQFGTTGQTAPAVLPENVIVVFGTPLPVNRFLLTGIVLLGAIGLNLLYRFTKFGLATRAVAEDETSAALFGLHPNQISLINVVAAHILVGALGILVAPLVTLDPTQIPNLIIPALAAALVARFTSFGWACAAGLAMGVIQSLITYLQAQAWFPTAGGLALPGATDLVYLVIVVAVMFWQGSKLPTRGQIAERSLPRAPAPKKLGQPAAIGFAVVIVAFLLIPFDWRQGLINSLIGILLCLSLVVITGYVGQISLVQLGLAGVSGFVISKLAVQLGIGFPWAPLIGIAVATAIGLLVAAAAVRVRGVNLAIVTLAAAIALQNFGFNNVIWGGGPGGSPVPTPSLAGIDLGPAAPFPLNGDAQPSPLFGILCALVVVLAALLIGSLRRSRLGHRMLAVRSNERAAAAAGINVTRIKLTAFALSSLLAGVAGSLYAYDFLSVSTDRFGFFGALTALSFAYIGGITTVRGALLAGVGVTAGISAVLTTKIGIDAHYLYLLGGLLLVVTIIFKPEGLAAPKAKKATRDAKSQDAAKRLGETATAG